MDLRGKFTEHPASVDETYFEHMAVAAGFSRQLAKASMCAAVHAIFPWMHCTTASAAIKDMHTKVTSGARADTPVDTAA